MGSSTPEAAVGGGDCPVCLRGPSTPYAEVDGHGYHECGACGSLFIDPAVLARMDAGESEVGCYAAEYWDQERKAALERAHGIGLCLAGEAILYCRRPVQRFLDVGAGAGELLRQLQQLLDPDGGIFHGVEKFPPDWAARLPNFHRGDVAALEGRYDAGVCIEVVEHLTPAMLDGIVAGLARASNPGAFWIFNTGMPDYVKHEDPDYLDPLRRGHVVSYSAKGVAARFEPHGFRVGALPGRSFAFYAEYQGGEEEIAFDTRFYQPLPENRALIERHGLLACAAFETARSYFYQAESQARTRWALALDEELRVQRTLGMGLGAM